jgi:very-short-patch-repair endonuclease
MAWRRDSINPVAPRARRQAKLLRETLTDPERKLWWHLRHRLPRSQTHFRKQVAIGPYIADFVCLGARLIVEVDGEQHGFTARQAHDAKRSRYLANQGFRVLRFSNGDVRRDINVVLDTILASLSSSAHTPQGEGHEPQRQ